MRRPDLGSLKVGSAADIALFRLEEGEYTFFDTQMARRNGTTRLINTLTMVDGVPLPRTPERKRMVWAVLPAHQQSITSNGGDR
jgi:dihydroorotase